MTKGKQHLFFKKEKEKQTRRRSYGTCARGVEDPQTTLSHCNCNEACNTTEEVNEPVDPAAE